MIIKFFWYLSSFCVIVFVLISNPKSNTLSLGSNESKSFSFRSSQADIQKLIACAVFFFFVFTLLCLFFS
uniref:Probable protein-export membrane protein SecG n=1 Tax=Tolypiocladia glomerulata TaxID=860646 RepID=A0A1Z1MV66_9FLOR|nr:preprotein-translocase subunit g [Tolypiocladia glomerulata]ARW69762.1 preprotein-translocase subunit g [Tolypiocladia glomerulata]